VIQLDLFGEIDSNITFDYEPLYALYALYALDGEALARVRKSDADTAQVLIHGGVISASEERLRLVGDPNSGYQGLDGALPAPQMGQDDANNGGGNPNHDPKSGRFTSKNGGVEANQNESRRVVDQPDKDNLHSHRVPGSPTSASGPHSPVDHHDASQTDEPNHQSAPNGGSGQTVSGQITVPQLHQIFRNANVDYLQQVSNELNANLVKYKLDTPYRKSHFFGQIRRETGPTMVGVSENLGLV